jgi:hypothetical protein
MPKRPFSPASDQSLGTSRCQNGALFRGDLGPIPVGVQCMDSENTDTNKCKKLSNSFKHGRILGQ